MRSVAPLVVEEILNAPVNRVWNAITDKDEMKRWYFDFAEFKPIVGFEFQFYGGTEEKQFLHLCKIIEVFPDQKLSYSWRYDGYTGNSVVIFELFEEGEQTRLKLTHEGLETFPSETRDFNRENFFAGWTYIIGTSLKEFVDKTK